MIGRDHKSSKYGQKNCACWEDNDAQSFESICMPVWQELVMVILLYYTGYSFYHPQNNHQLASRWRIYAMCPKTELGLELIIDLNLELFLYTSKVLNFMYSSNLLII